MVKLFNRNVNIPMSIYFESSGVPIALQRTRTYLQEIENNKITLVCTICLIMITLDIKMLRFYIWLKWRNYRGQCHWRMYIRDTANEQHKLIPLFHIFCLFVLHPTRSSTINLFIINSDAILNREALSRVKNNIYKPLSLEEYTIQEKYCDEHLLTMGMCQSIF